MSGRPGSPRGAEPEGRSGPNGGDGGSLSGRLGRYARWGGKGFSSVLDQAAFAGANFALNILMARWLEPEAYGVFAVAHTLFLIAMMGYGGLFIEPLLVFGSAERRNETRAYLGTVLHLHWRYGALAVAAFLVVAAGLWAAGAEVLAGPIVAVALTAPLILLLWFARKACYLWLEPWWAARGSFLYLLLLVPAAYAVHRAGWLGPTTAFLLMGAASALAGGWLLAGLRPTGTRAPDPERKRSVMREHWGYGKWSASTWMLTWIRGHIYFLVLPLLVALEAAGSLKALLNLLNPLVHGYTAVTVLFMALLVRLREDEAFDRSIRASLGGFTALATAFWLALGFYGEALVGFLYGGRYVAEAGLLWILGAVPLLNGLTAFLTAGLRALEKPEKVFYVYAGSGAVALAVGVPLMWSFGLLGAALGLVLSELAGAGMAAVILTRTRRGVWRTGAAARDPAAVGSAHVPAVAPAVQGRGHARPPASSVEDRGRLGGTLQPEATP